VLLAFVDIHRAAEDEDRVVVERLSRWLGPLSQHPLVELTPSVRNRLGENARPGIPLMDDRKHSHRQSVSPSRHSPDRIILHARKPGVWHLQGLLGTNRQAVHFHFQSS
jgi:hypothetical protein